MKRTLIVLGMIAAVGAITGTVPSAWAVNCGDTILVSTTLTESLNCPTGDGLIIGASGVELDLDRHTITGGGVNGTAGIRILNNLNSLIVRNGSVRNFFRGIDGTNSQVTDSEFCELKVSGNKEDGIKVDGSNNLICDNKADKNGRHGINVVGGSNTILDNSASDNAQVQIKVQGSASVEGNNMKTKSTGFKPIDAPSASDDGDNKCKIPKGGKVGDIGGSPCPAPKP
jgi:parallel beta-helix repeat protein